eukprot:4154719-Pyramimonas_sp.AAC.1
MDEQFSKVALAASTSWRRYATRAVLKSFVSVRYVLVRRIGPTFWRTYRVGPTCSVYVLSSTSIR